MTRLLADEHFPLDSVAFLRQAGYDVKAVILEMAAADDRDVISFAIAEQRIIVTYDRDYGELIFRYGVRPPQGVIYMRNVDEDERVAGKIVFDILQSEGFDTAFKLTVVNGKLWRQRMY